MQNCSSLSERKRKTEPREGESNLQKLNETLPPSDVIHCNVGLLRKAFGVQSLVLPPHGAAPSGLLTVLTSFRILPISKSRLTYPSGPLSSLSINP